MKTGAEAVKHYRAAHRAGTHATKNKKLVSGAGKKLWKQKGTGRSIRSPLWRHGGTVHGPDCLSLRLSAQEAAWERCARGFGVRGWHDRGQRI